MYRPEIPDLTKGEERLQHDSVFGCLNHPADLKKRDDHFREGLELIRTVKNQPESPHELLKAALEGISRCFASHAAWLSVVRCEVGHHRSSKV
jgi:hypothetical protein